MDFDSDYDCDAGGGVWGSGDGFYGGDVDNYYRDAYDVGGYADVEIHAGDDLYGDDDRDLAAEFGIGGHDGDVDIAAELGVGDVDGDGLSAAEYGIDGHDDLFGDRDIAGELGLGDDDYFDENRSIIDYDFEAGIGVHRGDLEAVNPLEGDDVSDGLVPVVVDDDDDGDELVPVVEVVDDDDDDSDSDYFHYLSNRNGVEHLDDDDDDDDDDDVLTSLVFASRRDLWPESAIRLRRVQSDDDEDLQVHRDNTTSTTREITIQTSPLTNSSNNGRVEGSIGSNSNPNARRNEEQKDGEMASSSEVATNDSNANGIENDGVSCPICLESWTTEGDHIICCLPCGHVYGMSCIKSWLQQPNSGKCPICNKACSVKGIRKIYGLTIATAEKDLKEKIQLLEARCASLELNNGDWQRKEAEWRQSEAVLLQQLKPDAAKN